MSVCDIKNSVSRLHFPHMSGDLKVLLNSVDKVQVVGLAKYHAVPEYVKITPQWVERAEGLRETLRTASFFTCAHKVQVDSFSRLAQPVSSQVGVGTINHFQDTLAPMFERVRQAYQERLETYPNLSSRLGMLAKRGWFISMFFGLDEFDQISTPEDIIDDSVLEGLITKFYRESLCDHSSLIIRSYPDREFAIGPALSAHLRGEYALSVPVFFVQAEGISYSVAGKNIFSGKKGGAGHISSLAGEKISDLESESSEEEIVDPFRLLHLALWQQLSDHQPISYSAQKRKVEEYAGLNRHTVLHGEALDYATELNSLKAFSFLSYVASLLSRETQD